MTHEIFSTTYTQPPQIKHAPRISNTNTHRSKNKTQVAKLFLFGRNFSSGKNVISDIVNKLVSNTKPMVMNRVWKIDLKRALGGQASLAAPENGALERRITFFCAAINYPAIIKRGRWSSLVQTHSRVLLREVRREVQSFVVRAPRYRYKFACALCVGIARLEKRKNLDGRWRGE
jgi:hypothetical protein